MKTVFTRRAVLTASAAMVLLAATGLHGAFAQSSASTFVKGFADQLTRIVNGPQPYASKKAALGPVIDANVDVTKIGRFCLGRFWATATPSQQQEYLALFHKKLLNSISGHLGEYQGVSYKMTGETPQGDNTLVGTDITRPNAPEANVQWVVESSGGSPKVIDVVAEGTSLRLTERSDYASYMSQHGNNVAALIAALQKQIDSAG